jgi:hypothetical protein
VTAQEYFDFFYPYFSDVTDPRFVSPEMIAIAMSLAQSHRPACLLEEQQNEAQAHYAAWLLESRRLGLETTGASGATIVKEKQGNVEVQYGSATAASQAVSGPNTPYASWKALADQCGFGAIIVSNAFCGSGGAPP